MPLRLWSLTLSFLESEILRAGGPELDLSEMWIVRNVYFEKAVKYVRLHGSLNLDVYKRQGWTRRS